MSELKAIVCVTSFLARVGCIVEKKQRTVITRHLRRPTLWFSLTAFNSNQLSSMYEMRRNNAHITPFYLTTYISCHSLLPNQVVLSHTQPLSYIIHFEKYPYLFRFRINWRAGKRKE